MPGLFRYNDKFRHYGPASSVSRIYPLMHQPVIGPASKIHPMYLGNGFFENLFKGMKKVIAPVVAPIIHKGANLLHKVASSALGKATDLVGDALKGTIGKALPESLREPFGSIVESGKNILNKSVGDVSSRLLTTGAEKLTTALTGQGMMNMIGSNKGTWGPASMGGGKARLMMGGASSSNMRSDGSMIPGKMEYGTFPTVPYEAARSFAAPYMRYERLPMYPEDGRLPFDKAKAYSQHELNVPTGQFPGYSSIPGIHPMVYYDPSMYPTQSPNPAAYYSPEMSAFQMGQQGGLVTTPFGLMRGYGQVKKPRAPRAPRPTKAKKTTNKITPEDMKMLFRKIFSKQ